MSEIHEQGFTIIPSLLSSDEVAALRAAADALVAERGATVIDEALAPEVPKMVFGPHPVHDTFAIVPRMGPPGTVIVFDCLIIHGSAPNISPWPRRIFYMNFVPAACCDLKPLRPRLDCDPIPVPLTPLPENCLVAP